MKKWSEFRSKRKQAERERKELRELMDDTPFEKGDIPALIVAALTTVLPFAIVMFVLLFFIPMILMRFL